MSFQAGAETLAIMTIELAIQLDEREIATEK